MGKRSRKEVESLGARGNEPSATTGHKFLDDKVVDPTLALLFASSAGPVQAPPKSRYSELPPPKKLEVYFGAKDDTISVEDENDGDEDLSSLDGDPEDVELGDLSEDSRGSDQNAHMEQLLGSSRPERKRKRKDREEDLEGKYLDKLAREEAKEEAERQAQRKLKRQRLVTKQSSVESDKLESSQDQEEGNTSSSDEGLEEELKVSTRVAPADIPLHESLTPDTEASELEKATRTVFLANVCTSAISSKSSKKTLLAHMGSILPALPEPPGGKSSHRVESLRFRSTAYASTSIPKKAAFAKKELMAATTKSTNAYVVYSTAYAAREAVKRLNGTVVLDRHLRVDGVAHPAKTDHRRCVFVGNLGFVDDESMLDQGGENERKRSKIPSDIEEGLWRQFGKAGKVESVRVVRDEKTRVGKGFAYVQFHDPNTVEAALLFNDKKYPPMLPRILRVVRAKAMKKTALASSSSKPRHNGSNNPKDKNRIYNPKVSSEASSLQGRAGKLLGRAGAANYKKKSLTGANDTSVGMRGNVNSYGGGGEIEGIAKTPQKIVFEGYRATSKNGRPKDLKLGGKGGGSGKKGGGKPKTRSTRRASEWKKSSGKGGKE